jgi:hypothetical protein
LPLYRQEKHLNAQGLYYRDRQCPTGSWSSMIYIFKSLLSTCIISF